LKNKKQLKNIGMCENSDFLYWGLAKYENIRIIAKYIKLPNYQIRKLMTFSLLKSIPNYKF
jgi:ABC-type multidrug transport system ATPase subunit